MRPAETLGSVVSNNEARTRIHSRLATATRDDPTITIAQSSVRAVLRAARSM